MGTLLFIFLYCLLPYRTVTLVRSDSTHSFNISVYEPNKTEECSHHLNKVGSGMYDSMCKELKAIRSSKSGGNCSEYLYNNKKIYNGKLRSTTERAAVQYCNGTDSFLPCFVCFNTATETLWNKHPCPQYERWRKVPECMKSFPNPTYNWSRAVILNNTHEIKLVSHTAPPYNKCADLFDQYFSFNDFNVTFPVYMYRYSEDENREYTVMLGLIMNAFEDNNPVGTTINETKYPYGVRCIDLLHTYYLRNYYSRMTYEWIFSVPLKITESFKTLRADMCNNVSDCTSCFNRGDAILFYYTRNMLMRVSKVLNDYNETYTIYRECFEKYKITPEYVAILNDSHYGMDQVNMNNCSNSSKDQYNFLKENPSVFDTSKMTTKAVPIINVVAFNAYSYFGYALRHNGTACSVIEDGEMLCFVMFAGELITNLRTATTEAEEDADINGFSFNVKACGYFELSWGLY